MVSRPDNIILTVISIKKKPLIADITEMTENTVLLALLSLFKAAPPFPFYNVETLQLQEK